MDIPAGSNPYENISIKSYKIVVIGDSGVGKTTLIKRMKDNEFHENIDSTIGAGSIKITYNHDCTSEVVFEFLDTAGQEQYRSLATFYIKNAVVGLICFNPNNDDWIDSIIDWKGIVVNKEPNIHLIAVATKYDLWKNSLNISSIFSNVKKRCNISDIQYVSSLSGENVDDLLSEIDKKVNQTNLPESSHLILQKDGYDDNKPKCKC